MTITSSSSCKKCEFCGFVLSQLWGTIVSFRIDGPRPLQRNYRERSEPRVDIQLIQREPPSIPGCARHGSPPCLWRALRRARGRSGECKGELFECCDVRQMRRSHEHRSLPVPDRSRTSDAKYAW